MTEDGLLTIENVAQYLQMPVAFVEAELNAGRIRSIQIGDQQRFEKAAVDRYIQGQRPSQTYQPDSKKKSAWTVIQQIISGILIGFGTLYVGYVIKLEVDAGAFDVGLMRGIVVVLTSLVASAAWILPIGIAWMFSISARKRSKLRPEDYRHLALSPEQERIISGLRPEQQHSARMEVRKIMAQRHLEKYGTLPPK